MIKATLLACLPILASAAEVRGEWNLHLQRFGEEFAAARVNLTADGPTVKGTLNELKLAGRLQGDRLHLVAVRPNGKEWGTLDGQVEGDEITGMAHQGAEEFA